MLPLNRASRRSPRLPVWLLIAAGLSVPSVAFAAPAKPVLMVLYFDNNSGDRAMDPLSKGLADMMITDLASVSSLQVVERDKLEAVLKEIKLQQGRYFDPATAQRLGKGVGAQYALAGAFAAIEPDVRIDVRVIRVETAEVVKAAQVTGKKDEVFALEQKLVSALSAGLPDALAEADTERARAHAEEHRVPFQTVLAYGKGLDLSDTGDLAAASKQMQSVVRDNPHFKIASDRYLQIMRALYAAKDARKQGLGENERLLVQRMDAEVDRGGERGLSYRILRGQYLLQKLSVTLDSGVGEYRPFFDHYVENQVLLGHAIKGRSMMGFHENVDEGDRKLAKELGIDWPGKYSFLSSQLVLRDTAQLILLGKPPFFGEIKLPRHPCFFRLDERLKTQAFALLKEAIEEIPLVEKNFVPRETIRALQLEANGYLATGSPELAIASLQTALDRFPKAPEFDDVEKQLRGILAGEATASLCTEP